MKRLPSLCIVSPQGLGALVPGESGPGGAELQQAMLGRELSRRGHRVVYVAERDQENVPFEACGIRILTYGPRRARGDRGGWRALWQAGALFSTIAAARAEVVTARSNHLAAAVAGCFGRASRVPFIFAAGHDGNCDPRLAHRAPRGVVAAMYAASLSHAAAVVAQGERQKALLAAHYGVQAVVIPNAASTLRPPAARVRQGVVWVGTLSPRKGPDRLLDLAVRLPHVAFTVVGGGGEDPVCAESIRTRAASQPNVSLTGALPREESLARIASASVLVNTSRSEGFPNVLIEAWSLRTPVVSLSCDPDGVIEGSGLGLVGGDLDGTAAAIDRVLSDESLRAGLTEAGSRHVNDRHGLNAVADRWQELLELTARRTRQA